MAYFAQLDEENCVIQVLVTDDNDPNGDKGHQWLLDTFGGIWIETFVDGLQRKNYAGIGFQYDANRDAFISPKPFASWILNEETCQWIAPKPKPDDDQKYVWSETEGDWVNVS